MRGRGTMKTRKRSGMLVNLLLILLIAALYFATSKPDAAAAMAQLYYAPNYRGHMEGAVALQFPVSWNAAALDSILDTLSAHGAKATFAVSGAWAENNPALLLRMAADGHEIATMGDDPSFDGKLSLVQEDIAASLTKIETECGVRPVLYYSGGRNVTVSARAAKKLGLTHVLCTLDLRCAGGSAEEIVQRGLNDPIEGSIILMQPTAAASDALAGLLNGFKGKGLNAVRVSDVLGAR